MPAPRSKWCRTGPVAFVFAALATGAGRATAQVPRAPDLGGHTVSLGQPKLWHWQVGLGAGALNAGSGSSGAVRTEIGTYHSVVNPIASFAEIGAEGYSGMRGADPDGGLRGILRIPYMGMGVGADYNFRDGRVDFLHTIYTPVRRGGLFGRGTLLRFDWYPFRSGWTLGVSLPLLDQLAGRDRPLRDHVVVAADLPLPAPHRSRDLALTAALDTVRVSAEWVRRLVVPFTDHDARTAALAEGRTAHALTELRTHLAVRSAEAEVRFYHAAVEHAFAIATGSEVAASALAQRAREVILEEILVPYDRLLGRKKHNDTIDDLAVAARGRFARWLATGAVVGSDSGIERSMTVFEALTGMLEVERRTASREWDDARLSWLPLQYGLLPEQYDEQEELESLVARVTGGRFHDGNQLAYVANLQFHAELLKMIGETRDYQVLWIHDFPAITAGRLDWASAAVVHRYLETLTARVEAYDVTLRLPSFFILLDQHYYEERHSRLLMNILEDPLSAKVRPPGATDQQVALMVDDIRRLREAVHRSRALMAEAREYGGDWLHNRIKVHVNITNRADASFYAGGLVSTMFGYPDDVMRDHRKVAFRDVREDQPDSGRAILTGTGVGQQYLGPGWDDRSLMARGAVLADLKTAAREALLSQGLRISDIPAPLLAEIPAPEVGGEDGNGRAALFSNGTGYLSKPVDVAKAVLYSMMPPGSVFKIPDSLWNSSFFAGLLTGAALRGCHVLIIAPALANAPSNGFPQMGRANELFARLLLVRQLLATPIAASGGELRTGLYALPLDEHGFASRAGRWADQVDTSAFLRALLPFVPDVEPVVRHFAADSARWQPPPDSAGVPLRPRLHQKVQFMATAPLWHAITASTTWPRFMEAYLQYRRATYDTTLRYEEIKGYSDSLEAIAVHIAEEARGVTGAASFAILGSQNMGYRSMFMDGEIGMLFTGPQSLPPLVDLVFMAGTVTWVDDRATLDRLLPPPSELERRFARLMKDGL